LARVPHSCAFCAQEWDSTEASYMGFGLHRGGWPIFAPAQTRLPHPSWFSKGEHHGRWHQETILTPSSAFWAWFTSTGRNPSPSAPQTTSTRLQRRVRVPHSCAFIAQEWDSTELSYMGFGLHRDFGWRSALAPRYRLSFRHRL